MFRNLFIWYMVSIITSFTLSFAFSFSVPLDSVLVWCGLGLTGGEQGDPENFARAGYEL